MPTYSYVYSVRWEKMSYLRSSHPTPSETGETRDSPWIFPAVNVERSSPFDHIQQENVSVFAVLQKLENDMGFFLEKSLRPLCPIVSAADEDFVSGHIVL